MSDDSHADAKWRGQLLAAVNDSGYPFQIGVSQWVDLARAQRRQPYGVVATEYTWLDQRTGAIRFVDVILRATSSVFTFVVECKRLDNSDWVFLSEGTTAHKERFRCAWYRRQLHQKSGRDVPEFPWSDANFLPLSQEAEFVVHRQEDGKRKAKKGAQIEPVASELVRAARAMIEDEFLRTDNRDICVVVPLVITTARLSVCNCSHRHIDYTTGKLIPDDAEIIQVPWVRFRKSFELLSSPGAKNTTALSEMRRSSIFVVHVSALLDFLSKFGSGRWQGEQPWNVAR